MVNFEARKLAPQSPTPAMYDVEILHRRRAPLEHVVTHTMTTWLVDLDDLPRLRGWRHRLCRFDLADHIDVVAFLAEHGVTKPARILMLAQPRVYGYVFNPLTVFYCLSNDGEPTHLVAEVRNTYGGRHTYLMTRRRAPHRQGLLRLAVLPGGRRVHDASPSPRRAAHRRRHVASRGRPAVRRGHDRPSTTDRRPSCRHCRRPLENRAVMAGIKRHGISLYLKGLRPHPRPNRRTMTSTLSTPVVDANRWPDVARVPERRFRAAIARSLTKRAVRRLPIRVLLPDGTDWGGGHADDPCLRLNRPEAFFQRLGAGGLIGFGEGYQAGDWDTDDLAGLLTIMASRLSTLVPSKLQRLRGAAVHRRPVEQDNTIDGARENIHRHYDLSNDLFQLFLDSSLSYSSALFVSDPTIGHPDDLTTAQHRKIDRLLDIAAVGPGSRVLEIGTGWGELAIRAASRGAHVTTVTISVEQAELARERIAAAGLSDLVDVQLSDYREVTGEYDAIVSVEMVEAVGWNHWATYFGTLDRLLAPGGRVGLQAITMPHDRMLATRDTYTWIVKYIFPGGHLPVRPGRASSRSPRPR